MTQDMDTSIENRMNNAFLLGKIDGKLYTLKQLINGYFANDNPLKEKVEEIEKLINKIEL
jgi:hypothetical protein